MEAPFQNFRIPIQELNLAGASSCSFYPQLQLTVEDTFFPEYMECDRFFDQNDIFKQENGGEQLLLPSQFLRSASPDVTSLESSICPKQLSSFADVSDLALGPGPESAQFEISVRTVNASERGDGALEKTEGKSNVCCKIESQSTGESKVFSC